MNHHPTIKNLLSNERGNVMMTFGLTSMIAMAAIGGALDFGRTYQQKSKMQNALDAAVVSGVAKYRESNDWAAAQAEATAIFSAVFNNAVSPTTGAPNPTAGLDQPLVTFTQSGTQLSGNATLTANTPFMHLVIGANLTVSANSTAVPPNGKMLEVALMVDLTGSMGWAAAAGSSPNAVGCESVGNPTKKIDYLKCASEDLFDILLPANNANSSTVRIGIAPFADYVNAGEYAAEVTGKEETGAYAKGTDLAKTKQAATFSGNYSGWTGGTGTGNQFGAMGATATSGSTNTAAGAVFKNSHCAAPGGQQATMHKRDGLTYGIQVPIASSNTYTGTAPAGLTKPSSGNYARANQWNVTYGAHYTYNNNLYWYSSSSSGYFAPLVSDPTGLTIQTRNASGNEGNVGVGVYYVGSASNPTVPSYLKKNTGGFWRVTGIKTDGTFNYVWDDDSSSSEYTYYLPLYTTHTTGVTQGCESAVVAQPSSKLISCVTERVNGNNGTLNYSDDEPTNGKFIGPYNHGSNSRSNYSSDGKCYVAGREMPAVIPLTNDRSKLDTFVETATVGGATPGHLGTAWAQYLLSPKWSNVWPAPSTPAQYSNTGVTKVAILMTDGEYNMQFSEGGGATNTSAKQALMLCQQMRDNGIKVYTIGFGFAAGAEPPTKDVVSMSESVRTTPAGMNAKDRALDVLAKCASSNSSYFFPYDGQALRKVFKDIATSLSSDISGGKARLTD